MRIAKEVFFGGSNHPDYSYDDSLSHLFIEREWRSQKYPGIFFGPTINLDNEVIFNRDIIDDPLFIGRFVALTADYVDGNSKKFKKDFHKGKLTERIKITFRVNGNEYVTFESLLA